MHDNDSTPIEVIDFDSNQNSPNASIQQEKSTSNGPILLLAFFVLLLAAVVVFLFLPNYVANKSGELVDQTDAQDIKVTPEPKQEPQQPEPAPIQQFSAQELATLKLEAEELLLQIIEKQTLLENKAARKWANQEYTLALALGSEGDEFFRKQIYNQAVNSYKDSLSILTDLEHKINPTLEMHLTKGEQALVQAEKISALHHFEIALAIDMANTQASNGLKRAETIEELYALLEKGGKYEAANRLNDAKSTYQNAVALDSLSEQAKQALNRIDARLSQIELSQLIDKGHAALNIRQYGDAKTAFNSALKLSPNSKAAKQGLIAVADAIRNEKLIVLYAEAQHFEENEDWINAVGSYQQILQLTPNSEKAKLGLLQVSEKQDLLERLNEFNTDPLRLSTETVAADANQLLEKIKTVSNVGNSIQQAAAKLKQHLVLANQPISITLKSDSLTDIAIYKIGQFGKFSSKKIDLKPGKYTIVGSRSGFRDVRKVITVIAKMNSKTIQIQCDEPI